MSAVAALRDRCAADHTTEALGAKAPRASVVEQAFAAAMAEEAVLGSRSGSLGTEMLSARCAEIVVVYRQSCPT